MPREVENRKLVYHTTKKISESKGESIEDILYSMFEILHFSETPYKELMETAFGFMTRIKAIKNKKVT